MVFWAKVWDVKVVQAQQTIQYLDTLPKETENDFANIKQKITQKIPNDLEKGRKKGRLARQVDVFCQNLVYNLENYSSFKNTLLNNGSILRINDC